VTSTTLLATLVAVFISVALIAGLVTSWVLSSQSAGRRRLQAVTRAPESAPLPELLTLSNAAPADGWHQLGRMLGRSRKEMARLKSKLTRAGFRHPGAPVIYTILEYGGPVVVGALPLLLLKGPQAWLAAAAGAGIMFFAPGLIVEHQLSKHRREIENGLPDALDLLVVCIEAGSGLDQAIVKTSDELTIAYPALAEELRILTAEIRAGKARLEAFKNLAQRTKVDDVRALVAMLVQTDRFGTSIGQALRTHADVSRTKRRQRAEEKAQKIGVKLVFPLVLCFFPAFYVVVMGPAIIQFIRVFMK
jgi:tight adherence protein C